MFFFFIFSKVILTAAASYLISQGSPWLLGVFALFIIIDIVDSKVMGLDYRPYDSFFDRAFAYACFFTYLIFSSAVYPAIVYIAAFAVRDFFVAGAVQEVKNYSVRSNILDRGTMLVAAVFFSLQAGKILPPGNAGTEAFCFLIAGLILYQGLDKIGRIKEKVKAEA